MAERTRTEPPAFSARAEELLADLAREYGSHEGLFGAGGLIPQLTKRLVERAPEGEVELTLFRRLLALGAKLLALYFAIRAAEGEAAPVSEDGSPARLHSWQQRTYFSVFGPVRVRRRRYALPGGGGVCPLDAQLSLGPRCYSEVLSGWLEFALTNDAYDQAAGLLERILGVGIAKHALERMAVEDAGDVEAFYDQRPPPPTQEEGSILVVQADGKGVRMILDPESDHKRTEKREAVVTGDRNFNPSRRRPPTPQRVDAATTPDTASVHRSP